MSLRRQRRALLPFLLRERRAAFDARQTHNEERRRSARMTMLARCLKSHGQQAQRQALAYQLS